MQETPTDETERGKNVNLGPFQFRTPDRPCRVGGCGEKADGVVTVKNGSVDACIYCAPQFLQHEANEWVPLAGGRSLHTATDRFGPRVETAFCASCGEAWGVWTGPKRRECWNCGQTVYDDEETFEKVGTQLGGRFAAETAQEDDTQ